MSFLPENYKSPSSNDSYMKIQEGENKIRILSKPILGWEDWDDKKPIRFRFENKPGNTIDPAKPAKHFWAFLVWNYNEKKIQILHLTQATIRNKIQALSVDKDWGQPYFFDIKILKSGADKNTKYEVNPLPHKDLHPEIEEAFREKPCYLEALYDNADPFAPGWKHYTEGVFKKSDPLLLDCPTNNQLDELHSVMIACEKGYEDTIKATLQKNFGKTFATMSNDLYTRVLIAAKKARDDYISKNNEDVPF
jgi:hypothetical protein